MKKTPNNNPNNRTSYNINIENKNIINLDIKNIFKNKDKKYNLIKMDINKAKSLNNQKKIKSQNSTNNKSLQQNIEYIPTVIFNLNSNKIALNSVNNKSKIKSKSNENNKSNKNNRIVNFKKLSFMNKTFKNIKPENIIKNNIVKAKTQTTKNIINNSNSYNLNKKIISNEKVNETLFLNDKLFNMNKKKNETTVSLNSNKKELISFKLLNFINKNNFKSTSITIKNSKKNSKEKIQNKNIKKNINDDKNKKNINSRLIVPKKKISKKNGEINSKNYLKTFVKKFSNFDLNKNKKLKNKNIIDLSNSKITTTKNSNSNLSNLSNFYSLNILSKSFAYKKNYKNNNVYKTKIDTKAKNDNESSKISNNYFENISKQNIFPKTISNYKNNYINININIKINNKKNFKKSNNNKFYSNFQTTKNKISYNKIVKTSKNQLNLKNIKKKKKSNAEKIKINNKTNTKFKIKETLANKINKLIHNTNIHNLKIKQISYFDLKKAKMPMTYSSSIIQNESYTKPKEIRKIDTNINTDNSNTQIINTKDNNYYNQESLNLIENIKKYGLENNYISYPETDLNYYKIGRNIGHGAFGKVNIALHVLSGHIVAIKSFNKYKKSFPINRIYYEIKILKQLRNHKNIIKYFEHFETEKYFFIVMENISGGNLLNAINKMSKFSEPMAKNIFKQLIHTLKYLHNLNIVHRDIKPDNILLELDNTIKLCDFGVSNQVRKGQLLSDSCGTPAFIAPEILKNQPYNPYATDIWSSGVVLYIMVSGFFPFRGINENDLRKSIIKGNYPELNDISENLKDLLNKLLEINPDKRITLDEIINHPWLNEDLNNNDNNVINIFTKAEKFIYGKLKLDYRKEIKENLVENFTYKNILTEYEEENMNVKTISFIKTPYNSQRPRDDDEDLFYEDINIENEVMNFYLKVGEKNREYELRNNYEFDQGFIIAKKYNNKQRLMNSKNNSFNNEKNNQDKKNQNNDNNKNKMVKIDNIEDEKDKNINSEEKNKIIPINEKAIRFIEEFGYNKKYIIRSLQSNEVNHAIASYYLIMSLLNE